MARARAVVLSPREGEALESALDRAHQSWASCDELIHLHGLPVPPPRRWTV